MKITTKMENCIQECQECERVCQETLSQVCMVKGGEHMAPEHVMIMQDCVEICRLAADFMMRGSKNHAEVCSLCADICRQCADECEGMSGMEKCVEVCEKFAESCEEMIA